MDVMEEERQYFIHGKEDENGNIEIAGCIRNGISEDIANKIFDDMIDFARYAFNKSHAAAYGVVSYETAYLKAYYPVEFMAALITSVMGNTAKVVEYIRKCSALEIEILKPDINKSLIKLSNTLLFRSFESNLFTKSAKSLKSPFASLSLIILLITLISKFIPHSKT